MKKISVTNYIKKKGKIQNKFIRKILCFSFTLLICINSFAVVVSDNDGSAFITKAEFDSLKNNFQSQLDAYNTSIDNKIDNAIASYLAGIKVSKAPDELWSRVVTLNGGPMWFINTIPGSGTNTINLNKKITLRRQLAALGEWNWIESWKYQNRTPSRHANTATGLVVLYGVAGENSTTIESGPLDRIYQTRDEIDRRGNYGNYSITDSRLTEVSEDGAWSGSGILSNWWNISSYRNIGLVNSLKTDISMLKSAEESGLGSAWIYHKDPDGKEYLSNYATSVYPVINIHAYVHNYQSFSVPASSSDSRGTVARQNFHLWYVTENGKAYTNTALQEYEADLPEGYGYKVTANTAGEVIPADDSTTDNQYYLRVDLSRITTTDGVDYTGKQFGQGSDTSVYAIRDIQMPKYSSTEYDNIDVTDLKWNDVYFTTKGQETQTNEMNDISVKWKKITMEPQLIKISSFYNSILSSVAGYTVYNGGGVPLAKFIDDSEDSKIKLIFKTSTGTGNIQYMLSDEQFIEGAFDTNAKVKISGTATSGEEINIRRGFERDKILWLNCYATESEREATIETFSIS